MSNPLNRLTILPSKREDCATRSSTVGNTAARRLCRECDLSDQVCIVIRCSYHDILSQFSDFVHGIHKKGAGWFARRVVLAPLTLQTRHILLRVNVTWHLQAQNREGQARVTGERIGSSVGTKGSVQRQ